MPFSKGQSGNKNGKPKGTKNKTGVKLREAISNFLSDNFPKVVDDFHSLTPKDRVKLYTDLLQFGLPKLQAVSLDFDKMTDEQLNELIEQLKETFTHE
jgi:hypothetical protein